MKSRFIITALSLFLLLPNTTRANDFEAALSSETAQFTFRSDSSLVGWGGAELGLGLFYNDVDDYVAQLSLMQRRQPSEKNPLTLGVGARAYLGQLDNPDTDIFAASIGVEVRYTIAGIMPKSVYLTAHYAPEITSFADVEDVYDYNLGFQIEILPQTTAFLGYRHIEVEVEDVGDYELDDDRIHVGVRFTF